VQVRLTRSAERDLQQQWQYLATHGSTEIARAFERRAEQVIDLLTQQPQIGVRRDELLAGARSFPIDRRCLLFYRLTRDARGDILEILRVACGGRNPDDLF